MAVEITIVIVANTTAGAATLARQAGQALSDGKFVGGESNTHGGWAYRITDLNAVMPTVNAPVAVPDEYVAEDVPMDMPAPESDLSPTMGRRPRS